MPTTKGRGRPAKSRRQKRPRLIRNSERQAYKRCRWQWNWEFGILSGTPLKPMEEAKALRFGDLIHQSLAIYYKRGRKRGRKPWLTFAKLYEAQVDELGRMNMRADDETKWLDAADLGESMLRDYYALYHERDLQYEVLSSEQTFQVPLRINDPRLPGELRCVIVGTTDGIWRDASGPKRSRETFFAEHKTTKSIDLSGLPMDEQAGTYWTYAPRWMWTKGLLEDGVYPSHIMYNFLRKAMDDERPENAEGLKLNTPTKAVLVAAYEREHGEPPPRGLLVPDLMDAVEDAEQLGEVSAKQPAKRFDRFPVYRDKADRRNMHQRVIDEATEMELVRLGIMKVTKNPGPLYMPNCRGCPMRDPCELHETGADYEAMLAGGYREWDPYAAHEIIERW